MSHVQVRICTYSETMFHHMILKWHQLYVTQIIIVIYTACSSFIFYEFKTIIDTANAPAQEETAFKDEFNMMQKLGYHKNVISLLAAAYNDEGG